MIKDAVLAAINSGLPVLVRYFGGSSPGAEREIWPISLKDEKVRAGDTKFGEPKTFNIEKMELVVAGKPSVLAGILTEHHITFATLDEFFTHQSDYWKTLGWIVQRENDFITLHRTYKNGKLIKTPMVALHFEPTTYDAVFDGEKVIEINHRPRPRPWVLSANKITTKTYSDFGKAQLSFMELAAAMAPQK